jgi:hypothetical protein
MPKDAVARKNLEGDETPYGLAQTNVVYTALDYRELNDLDRLARFILAVIHSSIYEGTDREQFFAAQRCVATAIWDNHLYFTANNVLTRRDPEARGKGRTKAIPTEELDGIVRDTEYAIWEAVMRDLVAEAKRAPEKTLVSMADIDEVRGFTGISFIMNPRGAEDTSLHAEMQLVQFFSQKGLRMEDDQMGVSKPCCPNCTKRLTALGIDHSYYHDIPDRNWHDPRVAERWW